MKRDGNFERWVRITGTARAVESGLVRPANIRKTKPVLALSEQAVLTQLDQLPAENQCQQKQAADLHEKSNAAEPKWFLNFILDIWQFLKRNRKGVGKVALGVLGAVLAVLPSYYVVNDRLLGNPVFNDAFRATWCQSEFLCRTLLPSYFMVILPALILVLALFIGLARDDRELAAIVTPLTQEVEGVAGRQKITARWLIMSALAAFGIDALVCIVRNQPPGFELLGILVLFVCGTALAEFSRNEIREWLARAAKWLAPWGYGLIGLVILFFGLYSDRRVLPLALLVSVFCTGLAYRRRNELPAAGWIVLAAMIVLPVSVNAWYFSTIGDEYSFFTFGREIIGQQSLNFIHEHFFTSGGVYGAHPYFSSVIQALSMLFLGRDNFGWRMSSIILAAFSAGLLTLFLQKFVSKKIAVVSGLLLAMSHYLMAFSKIGYNNLQALFALTLVLWVAGKAVEHKRMFFFSSLGLALGFCLYVYPAALYVIPIPFLALLFFDPPWTKKGLTHWTAVCGAFFLLLFPLLPQPDYWLAKIPGTALFKPELLQGETLGYHFFSNLLYSLLGYVYSPSETHFVFVSYLDPIGAVLVPIGLGWMIKLALSEKFPRFWLISGLAMLIMVGATHDRPTPSVTRMFMLLPWWVSLSGAGIVWLVGQIWRWLNSPGIARATAAVLLVSIIVMNVWLAYGYAPQKEAHDANLEVLFLRIVQREAEKNTGELLTYFFLTEPDWGIDGIRTLQDAYHVPASQAQLQREAMDNGEISVELAARLQPVTTLVIIQPWMNEEKRLALEGQLTKMGKAGCEIHGDAQADIRFMVWAAPDSGWSCPTAGIWE